jgi:hypothetical protein
MLAIQMCQREAEQYIHAGIQREAEKFIHGGSQWLPLATQETEIRRIKV